MENKKIIDNLLEYHACILRLAESKCKNRSDAEDLVSDTYLAALEHIRRGGSIEYPKTWLANTFMHKWNDSLRKRYRMPTVVNFDTLHDACDGEEHFAAEDSADDEAAELRRRVLYLTRTTREVIVRHYFFGEELKSIARSLDIPEGTVKSRLAYGREQIRKGFGIMENYTNHIPQRLHVSNSGTSGRNMEPASLTDGDLIAQNLLILAYDKPLDIAELAKMIGIPTVYIEPIIDRLVDGELMVRTDSGKVYTDFIIIRPEDRISRFDAQLEFVHERYGVFRDVMRRMEDETCGIAEKHLNLREGQLTKLRRYVVFKCLQNFAIHDSSVNKPHPKRRDGGAWTAVGHIASDSENIRR
nr:RNA polymerase sigma factor [Clostridia bacterium]